MKTAKLLAAGHAETCTATYEEKILSSLRRNERLVLDQLIQSGMPMKAYEILEPLHEQGIRAPMTVYRALENLVRLAIVKKIATLNAYHFVGFAQGGHCPAFLICKHCMKTEIVEVADGQLETLFRRKPANSFDTTIEMMTECTGCPKPPSETAPH